MYRQITSIGILTAMVAILLSQATSSFAVGALFSPAPTNEGESTYIVGARAFVHRSGEREDLILQAGFAGSASQFVWIIPVPSQPAVQSADPLIFDELRRIFNPLVFPSHPAGGSQQGQNVPEPKPVPLGEMRVIAPGQRDMLVRWLASAGCRVSTEADTLLKDYAKRGWYFVAVMVRTTPSTGARWLQPIWITFSTKRATFPALLSSLNTYPINVQLYVAADVLVQAPGFIESSTTGSPIKTTYKEREFPLFFQIVTRNCMLTELRAMLNPIQITSDLIIVPK